MAEPLTELALGIPCPNPTLPRLPARSCKGRSWEHIVHHRHLVATGIQTKATLTPRGADGHHCHLVATRIQTKATLALAATAAFGRLGEGSLGLGKCPEGQDAGFPFCHESLPLSECGGSDKNHTEPHFCLKPCNSFLPLPGYKSKPVTMD